MAYNPCMDNEGTRTKERLVTFTTKSVNAKDAIPAKYTVVVSRTCGVGLITVYNDRWTVGVCVPREDHDVYLPHCSRPVDGCHQWCKKGTSTHCFHGWLWGAATEAYDCCLDYFGVGPFVQVCWLGGSEPPKPVKWAGRVLRGAAATLDAVMTAVENIAPSSFERSRLNVFLSTRAISWLSKHAFELDTPECGHPACEPGKLCFLHNHDD